MKYVVAAIMLCVSVICLSGFTADNAIAQSTKSSSKKYPPMKGVVYYKKRKKGYYSYQYLDGVNTRRFVDPSAYQQSPAGPFGTGFFFITPTSPYGGQSPYMH
jgi:hypothetical protein